MLFISDESMLDEKYIEIRNTATKYLTTVRTTIADAQDRKNDVNFVDVFPLLDYM